MPLQIIMFRICSKRKLKLTQPRNQESDWSPLAGRDLIIWPDNDDPGRDYAKTVAILLAQAGAKSIKTIQVSEPTFPKKWDLADDAPEGVDLRTLLDDAVAYEVDDDKATDPRGFVCGASGMPLKTVHGNIRVGITKLGIVLRRNAFSDMAEINGLPGFPDGEMKDAAARRLRFMLDEQFHFLPSLELFHDVIPDIAQQNEYHPVIDYFKQHTWDKVERIGGGPNKTKSWLATYGGAEDSDLIQAFGRIFFIAAVRRILHPGTKFDTLLVLISPQGKNKSSAIRIIAVNDAWYTDNLPIGADAKQIIEQITGVWIVEFSELMTKRNVEDAKAFLSRQDDRARPAYGRRRENRPRAFVGIGSANNSKFLQDEENRRWWPVQIIKFDLAALERDRDQLWAEAVHLEAQGESITLPEDLWEKAAELQADCREENPYIDTLGRRFGRNGAIPDGYISAVDVWRILRIPTNQRKREVRHMGAAMKVLGFVSKQVKAQGDPRGVRDSTYYQHGEGAAAEKEIPYGIEPDDLPF